MLQRCVSVCYSGTLQRCVSVCYSGVSLCVTAVCVRVLQRYVTEVCVRVLQRCVSVCYGGVSVRYSGVSVCYSGAMGEIGDAEGCSSDQLKAWATLATQALGPVTSWTLAQTAAVDRVLGKLRPSSSLCQTSGVFTLFF